MDLKLHCIAIDDELFALNAIENYCREMPFLHLDAVFSDPYLAVDYLQTHSPDLVFIDIQMPEISGICIAQELHSMFIFTTAYSRYAVEGFNLNAVDYLLKPFDLQRFTKAVEKAKSQFKLHRLSKQIQKQTEFIVIKVEYLNVKIQLSDILYIESLDNYLKFHTTKDTYLTLQTLSGVALLLPETDFIRIHKSFIVSVAQITHFTRELVIVNKKTLPVGRAYSLQFLSRMKQ